MPEKNIFDELLEKAEKINLQELLDKSMHEPDPNKRRVYDALYTYVLDKKQTEYINRNEFLI
ncbi:hypothetical protein N0K77_07990 [Dellaglioa algida]|nr:hypothetical protein [Dellaglioa algida]MDK1727321.1 hypothetical protein [Dellaglioa algida]